MIPSHIILHVTNVMTTEYCKNLAFILNNQSDEISVDIVKTEDEIQDIANRNSVIIMTTDSAVCDLAYERNIPFIPVMTEDNRGAYYKNALYVMEIAPDIDIRNIIRIYQRCKNIPWTVCETDRLIIREQTVNDIDDLYDIYEDPEILKYTEGLYEDRDEEIEYMKEYIDKQYRFFEYGVWALVNKEDGKLIGRAGISNREGYDIPEIGFVIGKEYRRKGYAKEALSVILTYASKELMMTKMQAFTLPNNKASIELLKTLGFEKSGEDVISGKVHDRYYVNM